MKAFAYLRVSGKAQIDGDGFPRQRESIAHYATSNGIELSAEFIDGGVSGTTDGFDRPGLTDMFAAIRSNGVRTILVERSDRLARDLMVGEIILSECRKLGVSVISAEGGVELTVADDDPTKKLIRQILGAVAEFDKCVTVQKLRAARIRAKKERGRCEGQKPYGDRPGEADVVKIMQGLRMGGKTYRQIADHLNETQAPTRVTGAKWYPATVSNILQANEPKQA